MTAPRVRAWVLALMFFASVPIAAQALYVNPGLATRDDALDENWFWGNLTWSGGKGGIRWGPPDGSEPLAGHGNAGSPPAPDVFTSEPLPRLLLLNVSRHMKVDLLLPAPQPKCPTVQVELRVGQTLVAGAAMSHALPKEAPPPPPGFDRCAFRMPFEVAQLEAGSALELRILYVEKSTGPYRYASSSETNSRIALPVFSPDDALYRVPEAFSRVGPPVSGPTAADALARLLGMLGLVAPSLGSRILSGRRGQASLCLALLLGIGLAGCLGDGGPTQHTTDAGRAVRTVDADDVSYVNPQDGELANETVGGIVGRAQDVYAFPIPGAHVYLLDTPALTRTDENGQFSFRQLKPGAYTLRVDRSTFESIETRVEVRASQVVRLNLTLQYDSGLDAGERPHRHDYWANQSSAQVFSSPLMDRCTAVDCQNLNWFSPVPVVGEFNLVRPGTVEVEVTLTFDSAELGYTQAGLMIQANNDPSPQNWSYFLPRASGEPFHVRTTWEMNDVGHQTFSTWVFRVYVMARHGEPTTNLGSEIIVGGVGGQLRGAGAINPALDGATITIHRGALPLEPLHPDHWKGADRLTLDAGRSAKTSSVNSAAKYGGCYNSGFGLVNDQRDVARVPLGSPSLPVPQGTDQLVLTSVQDRRLGTTGAPAYSWNLFYKSGEITPVAYRDGSPAYRKADAPEVSPDGLDWTWRIPVEETGADGIYNKRSAWTFVLVPDDYTAACNEVHVVGKEVQVTWALQASRAAA